MLVTLFPIIILARLAQPKNASSPISVTLFGILTLSRFSLSTNAYSPIIFTLSGMVILIKLIEPAKASGKICVTALP